LLRESDLWKNALKDIMPECEDIRGGDDFSIGAERQPDVVWGTDDVIERKLLKNILQAGGDDDTFDTER